MPANFIDFYISYPGHPRFQKLEIIEDDVIRVIVQKYEMIIFTNKGEVFANPDFGADLLLLLHETRLSATAIEESLKDQIRFYIPEIANTEYFLLVEFFEDPERHQEYMEITFRINDYEVYASVF